MELDAIRFWCCDTLEVWPSPTISIIHKQIRRQALIMGVPGSPSHPRQPPDRGGGALTYHSHQLRSVFQKYIDCGKSPSAGADPEGDPQELGLMLGKSKDKLQDAA